MALEIPIDHTLTIGSTEHNNKIKCKDPEEAIRQLRVLTPPEGTFEAEVQQRIKYSVAIASRV
eukprot:3491166-Ditylum_brightwellii.AAC.1